MGNHGKRDADPDLTVCIMVSQRFTLTMCLGCATIAILAFQRTNLAVMKVTRSMPTVDNKLFSLRRWQLFTELSVLMWHVAQLVLSRTKIQVLMRVSREL